MLLGGQGCCGAGHRYRCCCPGNETLARRAIVFPGTLTLGEFSVTLHALEPRFLLVWLAFIVNGAAADYDGQRRDS